MEILYNIISLLIIYLICYFNISFLLEKSKKVFAFLGSLLFLLSVVIPHPFCYIYQQLIMMIVFYLINRDFKKTTIAVLFNYFILILVDTLSIPILMIIHIDYSTSIFKVLVSFIVGIFSRLLIQQRPMIELWGIFQKRQDECFNILVLIIVALSYINVSSYYHSENIFVLIFFLFIFIYMLISQFIKSYRMKLELDDTMKYVEMSVKYSDELRIRQHEYKNMLLCIREMIPKNKQVKEFINSLLIGEENNGDYDILKDVLRVSVSPIRGLLYYKLVCCKNNEVHAILDVASDILMKKLSRVGMDTLKDITMVLGIVIDNAMESCIKTEQKSLSIYIYEEKESIVFQVSNTFKGVINIDLLSKVGYSTKGKNRGYGLSYAKRIVQANSQLEMNSAINEDVFIQYLKVKFPGKKK